MAYRVDNNQREIVAAIRKFGGTVQHLHHVGKGCPDILVGFRGQNWLFEVKTAAGKLTRDQVGWHEDWRGQVEVIRSVEDVIRFLF